MKTEIYYCDICRKRIDDRKACVLKGYNDVEFELVDSKRSALCECIKTIDVCPECKEELQIFLYKRRGLPAGTPPPWENGHGNY